MRYTNTTCLFLETVILANSSFLLFKSKTSFTVFVAGATDAWLLFFVDK
ncbi:TPA: hypothetical protein QCQ89_002173 [Bacillus cereus]|nr:hypothetical protein [Bacillus cereus]